MSRAPMSGWLARFQLPLDSHTASWSLTVTFM
jgi:hypothetical protein